MVGGVGKKNAQDLKALLAKRFLQRERERESTSERGLSKKKRSNKKGAKKGSPPSI